MVHLEIDGDFHGLSPEQDDVRVLLLGDRGSGKTSLIFSLVNDEFDPNVPAKMANITIPGEVTPENVALHIVDYSEREQGYDDLLEAIRDANVLCVVYSADEYDSLERVANHWVPTIRKCQPAGNFKPIILVANKIDLVEKEKSLDRVSSFIQEFVEVEAYIEVSAKTQRNVVELFSAAQKAIVYPLAPLFDPNQRVLTRKCRGALVEIFKFCDLDGDGLLSDHELNLFQEDCFGTPLQKDALDDLKSIIKQSTVDGIKDDAMTQTGFLFLHTLSIDKGRHDFTWQVLRKFNYDNQINIKGDQSILATDLDVDYSHISSSSQDSQVSPNSDRSDEEFSDGYGESEVLLNLDLTWIREHSGMLKMGLGFTLATLVSLLALKYLVRNGPQGSA